MALKRITQETHNLVNSALNSIVLPDDQSFPSEFKDVLNFQGKKSPVLAKKMISALTKETDIVLDPFFGSGAFVLASREAERKVLGIELDNYTFGSLKMLLSKYDEEKLLNYFENVKKSSKEYVMDLYETYCCGQRNYISKLHFDPLPQEYYNPRKHRDIKEGRNIKLGIKCPICKRNDKKFDEYDEEKINEANRIDTERFPNHCFIENSRINITSSTGADKYGTNFTNRAKASLLKIQDSINSLPDSIERDILEYALVYSIALAKIAMYGSGTDNLYHVIQYTAQEMNVWLLFEKKFNNILKYKEKFSFALQDNFNSNQPITLINSDYKKFLEEYDGKFDVIYTDPPYTDQCPYLEKSQYFRDWLKKFYNSNYELTSQMLVDELVVSDAPSRREKNFDAYYQDIDKMLRVFSKKTKDTGLLVFTLKLGQEKYFTTFIKFINYARKAGYEFVSARSIDNDDPTIRKQAAFLKTMSTQIIVIFQKLPEINQYWYIADINMEKYVVKHVYALLKTQTSHDLSSLVLFLSDKITQELRTIVTSDDKERIANIIKNYFYLDSFANVSLSPNELYIGLEDQNSLFIKLYDIVPILIKKYLSQQNFFTLDDIYYEIALILCDDNRLFEAFIKNEEYKNSIVHLIENYCEISNNVFVERKVLNKTNPDSIDISSLDGFEFEDLIKKLLQAQGYTNVMRIGGAGDRGIDLIAEDFKNPGKKAFFQCKRWIANVDSTPIQRLHSMKTVYGNDISRAICVTTSNYTNEAKIVAEQTQVELINGLDVITELEHYFPNQYYHGALSFK
ncbi:MAG: restriction endonuclease [Clostridia bacterium]|nr:restriction endonuclease [Clostridia bacterium]